MLSNKGYSGCHAEASSLICYDGVSAIQHVVSSRGNVKTLQRVENLFKSRAQIGRISPRWRLKCASSVGSMRKMLKLCANTSCNFESMRSRIRNLGVKST
ncbi:hypothetical protein PoB_001061000 [Plakobranchus ocellatus]|uniref:Uncharacterized protein n=1 Tax=Plakobranchus ocellatus TaxID=259542 RepID=A0AAV3YN28_9GAST|nr:hypothetical protein PoB_001061000 [Plakobranchus ocellatus]